MANLRGNDAYIMPKNKAEVSYKLASTCKNCEHFYSSGACALVGGNINPYGVCNLWTPMGERSPYKDKEYFEKEYDKSRGK